MTSQFAFTFSANLFTEQSRRVFGGLIWISLRIWSFVSYQQQNRRVVVRGCEIFPHGSCRNWKPSDGQRIDAIAHKRYANCGLA
jgi:hypothetical protein